MKTKLISLGIAMLTGMSVWADDVWNYNVYDDCSRNGYKGGYAPAPVDVQAVDLGLPSGIRWASCNVGAEKPEDCGNHYAWGEILPKEDYSWATYKYANGGDNKLIKYCNNASYGDNGFTDNKTTLEPEDDAAQVNWGDKWRMPTAIEMDELINNCTWTWTTLNGVNGYQVTSKVNSNSIFLPATGYCNGSNHSYIGSYGGYQSSSINEITPNYARRLYFNLDFIRSNNSNRYYGLSVRPVCQYATPISKEYFTFTLYTDGCESANVITCNARQQVNIMAVPENAHRHFVRWTDGNTDNPRLVMVTQDTTFTAEFADDPILTLVSSDDNWGYAYGSGQFKPNTSITISASPNWGYHFAQWSDGNTDNPRNIVLTCDTTFTAEFAQTLSGQCGNDLYWQYKGHTLTILGTGAMYDYNGNDMPWLLFRDTTDAVVLEQGITHIGNNAFNGFAKLSKIDLPNTLTSIGANVFAGCRKLYDIYAYPTEPPVADNSSFVNYNVNLYVPCDNLRDYQMDAVFGTFKYIQCMSATDTEQVHVDESTDHVAQKIVRDGQVYILRNGKTYTTTGVEVK